MEYIFRAVNAAERLLAGVRLGHGRIYCPHDDGCGTTTIRSGYLLVFLQKPALAS